MVILGLSLGWLALVFILYSRVVLSREFAAYLLFLCPPLFILAVAWGLILVLSAPFRRAV